MRAILTILIVLFQGSLLPQTLHAQRMEFDAVDALVDVYDKDDAPGVSIAISIDGEPVYQRWAGQADLAHDVPIGGDTRFAIASISKQFTAFAIMMLADEGQLTLDQDVRDFIPELDARPPEVTIRDLLNHTSGLHEANSLLQLTGAFESSPSSPERSLDLILRQRGGNFPAGERQEYSNTGYQLLAEIVARISGQPFPEFMSSRMFKPLGMDQTFVRTDPEQVVSELASGYNPDGDGFKHVHLLSTSYGSSGIISTPRDLLRWAQVFETGAIGGPDVLAAMAARSTLANGRRLIGTNGLEYRDFRGLDTWSHGGSTGGFRSFLLRIPEAKLAIVVMGNRTDFLKAQFAFDVAEVLLADRLAPKAPPEFEPESDTQLDRYVGDYRLFAGVVFSVRRDGDQLTFGTFGRDDAAPVPQIGKGAFMLDPARDLGLEFHDFADGQATEMRWRVSADGFIPAPRVDMEPVPQAPLDTAGFEGAYYSETLQQVVTVSTADGGLSLRTGDGVSAPLEQYQPDIFRTAGPGSVQRVKLVRRTDGEVTALLVSAVLAEDIEYRKLD